MKFLAKAVAALIVLALLVPLGACGGTRPANADPQTTTEMVTEATTEEATEEATTEEATEETTEAATEAATEATTEPDETTTDAAEKTPDQFNKAELLAYFNEAANRVRKEMPGYTYVITKKTFNVKLQGGILSIANPIINQVMKALMPGNPETIQFVKGKDKPKDGNGNEWNRIDNFLANTKSAAANLQPGDVTSATVKKDGANYAVTVKIITEVNPAPDGKGANSRVFIVDSVKKVVDDIVGEVPGLTADIKQTKLRFCNGSVTLTINPQGQVVRMAGGFDVKAESKNLKMIGMSADLTADMTSRFEAKSFVW